LVSDRHAKSAQKNCLAAEPFAALGIDLIVQGSLRDSQGQKGVSSTVTGAGGAFVSSAENSWISKHWMLNGISIFFQDT
jgi:hypothetical protein